MDRGHTVGGSPQSLGARGARLANGGVVSADVLSEDTLDAALAGIEVAYYLVHAMGSGSHFARLDREGARKFRRAAERAGVHRIVYLGGLQPPGEPSAHLESRAETGAILRDGPIPVTELRAGIVVGAGSAAFEVIRDLVFHLPVMVTPCWVRARTQPIALHDLRHMAIRGHCARCQPAADGASR